VSLDGDVVIWGSAVVHCSGNLPETIHGMDGLAFHVMLLSTSLSLFLSLSALWYI
jgi:hypothetical protein